MGNQQMLSYRLSEAHASYGTLADWQECVEVATVKIYGTPTERQAEWAEHFHTVPPADKYIGRICELQAFARAVA